MLIGDLHGAGQSQAVDLTLPDTLGNDFALVQLELPTDEPDPIKVLAAAKRRMDRIKHGHEAALAFRFQETIAGFSHGLYEASVDLFANRTLGTLTNVPGRRRRCTWSAARWRASSAGRRSPGSADEFHHLQLQR